MFWIHSAGRQRHAGAVRFSNSNNRPYLRAEAHVRYRTAGRDATRVTYHWKDDTGEHEASHPFPAQEAKTWQLATGKEVQTRWVEFGVVGQ